MAQWLKEKLFGRQLSHGSETEDPKNFEEAFQLPQQVISNRAILQNINTCPKQTPVPNVPPLNVDDPPLQAAYDGPIEQQQMTGNFNVGSTAAPGAGEMNAAYKVRNFKPFCH